MRLDHVAHICRSPRATHHFYSDVLGLTLTNVYAGHELMLVYAVPEGGSLVFSTSRHDQPQNRPDALWEREHVGLTVETRTQFDQWLRRLCDNAVQHRVLEDERIYFSDPDGLILEIELASPVAPDPAALDALARWRE